MRREIATSDFWFRTLMGERVDCSADKPEPGYYRIRWRGPETAFVPARIWLIQQVSDDPEDGEPGTLIADEIICAEKAELPIHWRHIWPRAGRHPITPEVYQEMCYGGTE